MNSALQVTAPRFIEWKGGADSPPVETGGYEMIAVLEGGIHSAFEAFEDKVWRNEFRPPGYGISIHRVEGQCG